MNSLSVINQGIEFSNAVNRMALKPYDKDFIIAKYEALEDAYFEKNDEIQKMISAISLCVSQEERDLILETTMALALNENYIHTGVLNTYHAIRTVYNL